MAAAKPGGDGAVTQDSGEVMLLEFWHITYLEEGVCEGGSGQTGSDQTGSDGAVELDSGDALGILAYYIPGGRPV